MPIDGFDINDITTILEEFEFDRSLLEGYKRSLEENKIMPNHEGNYRDRLNIFIRAFNRKIPKTLEDVEEELKKKDLTSLRKRDPIESVIYLCLKYNSNEQDNRINIEEFKRIFERCYDYYEEKRQEHIYVKKKFETIHDIEEYLKEYSVMNDNSNINRLDTVPYTSIAMQQITNYWNISQEENVSDKIVNSYKEIIDSLLIDFSAAHYYVIKYTYYFLVSNCIEFIELIKLCANSNKSMFIKNIRNYTIGEFKSVDNDYDYENNIGKYYITDSLFYYLDYPEDAADQDEHYSDKKIINSISDYVYIFGTPNEEYICDKTKLNSLFSERNRNGYVTRRSFALINEHVHFNQKDDSERIKAINSLTVEDLKCFRIQWNELYSIIFSFGRDRRENIPWYKTDRFLETLRGGYNFNRTLLIYYLMIMDHAINWKSLEREKIATQDDILKDDYVRINNILLRCGYRKIKRERSSIDYFMYYSPLMDNSHFSENLHELLKRFNNDFDLLLLTPKFERNKIKEQEKYFFAQLDMFD